MKFGYARCSTIEQSLDRQLEALKQANCQEIFHEKISGKNDNRPELHKLLSRVQAGDTVVVMKLDRLGRSLSDLIKIVTDLNNRKVHFVSLGDNFDTTTPAGRFFFHVMGAMAEFERNLILERVNSGIAHAQAHGTKTGRPFGRPATKSTPENMATLRRMVEEGKHVKEIAEALELTPPDVYKRMRKLGIREEYSQKQKEKKSNSDSQTHPSP